MELQTERLLLRNYKTDDYERVHLYGSLPHFSQYDIWGPNTEEDTRNFISAKIAQSNNTPLYEYEFAVCFKKDNLLIGGCSLRREGANSLVANLGYAINPDFQSKGYATEVATHLINFGFNELRVC